MNTLTALANRQRLRLMIAITGVVSVLALITTILAYQSNITQNTTMAYIFIGSYYLFIACSMVIGILAFRQYFNAKETKGIPVLSIVLVLLSFLIIINNWNTISFLSGVIQDPWNYYDIFDKNLSLSSPSFIALSAIYLAWIIVGGIQANTYFQIRKQPTPEVMENESLHEQHTSSTTQRYRKPLLIITICAIAMISLFFITRNKKTEVNMFIDCEIEVDGENGDGYADVMCDHDYIGNNSKITRFLNQISYRIEDNGYLSNGDSVLVTLSFNPIVYDQLKLEFPKQDTTITVEGFPERFSKASDIPASVLKKATALAAKEMKSDLYYYDEYDFTTLTKADNFKMEDFVLFKQYFIKSKYYYSDEILFLYSLRASGEINGEVVYETIYFAATIDDVATTLSQDDNYIYTFEITRDDNVPLQSEDEAITQILSTYDKQKVEEIL